MKKQIHGSSLELTQGDLTALPVDAIVNAANKFLAHGGGVAGAIVRKGGSSIQLESTALVAAHGPLATGEAVITGGGELPAKFVIHAVGPVWKEHSPEKCDQLLQTAMESSLVVADENDVKSIAFPAISTGIYGFPIDRAAPLVLRRTAAYLCGETKIERVIFCLFDDASYQVFHSAFAVL